MGGIWGVYGGYRGGYIGDKRVEDEFYFYLTFLYISAIFIVYRLRCMILSSFHSLLSFIHSFILSFFHSLLHSFIHSFIHSLHSLLSFIHSFIHSFLHSFSPSFIHSFSPFTSLLHSFIHSFRSLLSFYTFSFSEDGEHLYTIQSARSGSTHLIK